MKFALRENQETNLEVGVRDYTPLDNPAHEKSKSSPGTIQDVNVENSVVEEGQ